MPRPHSSQKSELAAEAWRLLFTFFLRTRHQRDDVLKRFGLTPNEIRALGDLDPKQGRPMRSLADDWGTDASNATWVVDRLEQHGYAERRAMEGDRRVKLVALTPLGARTKAAVMKAMYQPPAAMESASTEDLKSLSEILGKLLAAFSDQQRQEARSSRRIP
jgi:MarR family transcriptional regulator, organic hydroperoxide resistance regulator